jgi:hypothetical protein
MGILAVQPRAAHPDPSSLLATEHPARATLLSAGPDEWRFEVSSERPTRATIAIAWSPKWHLTLNDRDLPLEKSPDGLITLMLPSGSSRVALDYRCDLWGRLGMILTVLSGTILAWLGFSRRSTRVSSAGSP